MKELLLEFSLDLININQDFQDQSSMFQSAYNYLFSKGYVRESFYEAITSREKEYPTGLETNYCNVAIPHTEGNHIIKPFVYLIRPNNTIVFNNMCDIDIEMDINLIMMIGINDLGDQVTVLQKLMSIFNDKESMELLLKSDSKDEILNKIKSQL